MTQAFVRIVCTLDDTVGLWWAAVIEFLKTLFNFRAIMGAYIPPTRLTDAMVRTQWVLTRRLNRTGTRYLSTLVHIYGDLYDKLHYTRILIGSYLWPMEDRCLDDVTINVKCWVKGEITQVERSWIYLSQAWNNGKKIWSFNQNFCYISLPFSSVSYNYVDVNLFPMSFSCLVYSLSIWNLYLLRVRIH